MNERILIIDDERAILKMLTALLESEGYAVVKASDGVEGLELFFKVNPALVITDVKMHKKGGLAVLKEIKASGSDVDVIILTGRSDEATAIDCLREGAYDYLLKPLEDIDILVTAVSRALQKRRLESKNRQLIKQLEEMSIKDPLTGLYNFRHLNTCLDEELSRSARYGHPFSIVMLDIDHFKKVNDTYGHLFDDDVLKKLGEIMQANLRSADCLFRYGGEEFIVIMPETPQAEALPACERLLKAISDHNFECDGHKTHITASMGGAVYPEQSKDITELIRKADQALYQAKEAGRNRVVF